MLFTILKEEILSKKIILKKRKKIFTEDASYYVEDIRKNVVEKLGFDKVYKQGLNISTPINIGLQKIATDSLRQGLIEYDKRKGWRGALTNIKKLEKWNKKVDKFKLEKSINWDLAIVKKIDKFSIEIETEYDELNGPVSSVQYLEAAEWSVHAKIDENDMVSAIMTSEIHKDELGTLNIGRNISEFAWDGTDTYGDRLANGLYLYHVITQINSEEIEHRDSSADGYFKKGFGKMYLFK